MQKVFQLLQVIVCGQQGRAGGNQFLESLRIVDNFVRGRVNDDDILLDGNVEAAVTAGVGNNDHFPSVVDTIDNLLKGSPARVAQEASGVAREFPRRSSTEKLVFRDNDRNTKLLKAHLIL